MAYVRKHPETAEHYIESALCEVECAQCCIEKDHGLDNVEEDPKVYDRKSKALARKNRVYRTILKVGNLLASINP